MRAPLTWSLILSWLVNAFSPWMIVWPVEALWMQCTALLRLKVEQSEIVSVSWSCLIFMDERRHHWVRKYSRSCSFEVNECAFLW